MRWMRLCIHYNTWMRSVQDRESENRMTLKNNPTLTAAEINFDLLKRDVKAYCEAHHCTMAEVSTQKLYRGNSFLSARFSEKRMPTNSLLGLLQVIEQPLKRYEIQQEKPEPVKQEQGDEWGCKLLVNKEFGIVSFVILHNGEEFAKAHSKIGGDADVDIAKSISYAAHVCYKNVEQNDFVNRIEMSDENAFTMNAFAQNTPFKEYIRAFVGEKTGRGELARYVSTNYASFPTWGEKNMRHYLAFNRASKQVVDAFDAEWENYRKWARRG